MAEMIFAREGFDDVIEECTPLLYDHYREIAWKQDKIRLDIDYDGYRFLERAGSLINHTARIAGKLVGYSAFILRPHPHYKSTMNAQNDVIYLAPEQRGFHKGSRFIDYIETDLRNLGAQVIGYHVKDVLDWGPLLKRKGHERTDTIWLKWVGD